MTDTALNSRHALAALAAFALIGGCVSAAPAAPTSNDPASEIAPASDSRVFLETESASDFATTLAQLTAAIDARGFKTFAIVDHAAGAASVGLTLRPATLVIFGNPQGGTPIMLESQTAGIDLPLKALVYEDAEGVVRVATTNIARVLADHGAAGLDVLKGRIDGALEAVRTEAAR